MYTANGTLDRDAMLAQFAPLVKRLAHHIIARLPASVRLEDMVQAGLIGLVDAIGRFEESQGAQFETYATQRIRGAMLDELRAHDWLPRGVRRTQKRLEAAAARLEQTLGRGATEAELAETLGVSLREYQQLLDEAHGGQLLYYEDFGEEEDPFLDRAWADPAAGPAERLQDERFRAALVAAIEDLPEREKLLMSLYYEQEFNFREIAAVLGVSESRVCQIHSQAVARLRAKLGDW